MCRSMYALVYLWCWVALPVVLCVYTTLQYTALHYTTLHYTSVMFYCILPYSEFIQIRTELFMMYCQ
jgi:hypothetical protein